MPYYDILDDNDNVIAENVWIDGPSGGPPPVLNVPKLLMTIFAICGIANTFIIPIILFCVRDKFVENGWIYMSISNIVLGLPFLVVFILMLIALKKAQNREFSSFPSELKSKFQNHESLNLIDYDAVSDEEYIKLKREQHLLEAEIARLYVSIKFEKLFKGLSMFSYCIYPMLVLCVVLEMIYGLGETYHLSTFIFNYLAFVLMFLSIYKNYKRYFEKGYVDIVKRMVSVGLVTFFISTIIGVLLLTVIGLSANNVLIFIISALDLVYLVDSSKPQSIEENNKKTRMSSTIIVALLVGIIMLLITCGISIMPGPIYDAILAFDTGTSTDLTLPLAVWGLCLVVYIILTIVISRFVNDKLNRLNNSK